jgi:hypothetical protein
VNVFGKGAESTLSSVKRVRLSRCTRIPAGISLQTKDTPMKSILRVVSLVVVSFAAASAFAADAPSSTAQRVQSDSVTTQAAQPAGGNAPALLVKCTNPRECSVG